MRVNRALAKLHALLKTRGAAISVAALGAALTAGNLTAAPPGLAATVTSSALANAGITSTLFALMTQSNFKTLLASALFLCLAAGVGVRSDEPSPPQRSEPVSMPQAPEKTAAEAEPSPFCRDTGS